MKDIFINEWKGLFRNRIFLYLSIFFIISLAIVTWLGVLQNQKQIEAKNEANKHIRAQWDDMKPTNPHGAAHFGSYAFKSNTVLNSMDEGVNAVTGNVLRLEGHTQNDVLYSEASQSLLISKFGKLKPSLLFQFLIPLFLIFLSFKTITSEREEGRLKLIIIQGKSLKSLAFAKILSVWTIGIVLLLFATIIQLIFNPNQFNSDSILRLFIFISSYGAYYLIITLLTVFLSIVLKNSAASLASTIAIWIFWTIFLPKITGNAVEKLTPLPTRVEFQKAMDDDRSKGIDGHNPSGDREKEFEKSTLTKYKVDSLSQLPINFDGLVMQADEEYGNTVWDKHFGKLYDKFQVQKRNYQLSGLLNPFSSLQNLSMGTAGTDMLHHLDFLKQAENYRRVFIKTLNDKHAYGGSKTGDWDWKADSDFFKSVKDFEYKSPTLTKLLNKYVIDILSLLAWAAILLMLINYTSIRVSVL
jgi:ABC-2 type transport system permease protein